MTLIVDNQLLACHAGCIPTFSDCENLTKESAIYEKAPHFREGLSGGADGARTHDLGRDRPAF